ncbi:MAG TPA: glycosyl hydrolase family 65 protein, partial [Anaerolineae bacterium]|nr:glycosyl hydrolase family 65 protein [Anaerolineae bacterium]
TLQNNGQAAYVRLAFLSYFDLEDAWFTSLAENRNAGEVVQASNGQLVARAHSAPETWAVAVGGALAPAQVRVSRGPHGERVGQFEYAARLEAGETRSWTFAISVETTSGAAAAVANLNEWLPQRDTLKAGKQALYGTLLSSGPRFHSPDAHFDAAFDIARANMQMLEAESPALGRYLYAGLEMFPFWFASDGYYCLPGLMAGNLVASAQNHVLIGTRSEQNGRIPHQISPSGRVVVGGNAQETPQWVMAVWDAYRWTGDRDFLAAAYPTAAKGLFDYTLDDADRDGDLYPEGPGMVEKQGMGPEKVDSASYLWAALQDLAQMAGLLGDTETATRAQEVASRLQASFDADWWLPAEELYADSMQGDPSQPPSSGQWSTVVPLEVGIAPAEHARATLARLQRGHLNEWGLVHTLGSDERVWTLPTATLSRGAFRNGDADLGFAMLQHLAQTLDHGSIGTFHELIPQGLSFVQLWSGATFVRGVVEDLMGIQVRADLHAVTIAPKLPASWAFAELEDLRFGGHTIRIRATRTGITVTHTSGPVSLSIAYRTADGQVTDFALEPGGTFSLESLLPALAPWPVRPLASWPGQAGPAE